MNRRGFMKALLGCSAAAALPVVGKAVSNKPVAVIKKAHNVGITGLDSAKSGSEWDISPYNDFDWNNEPGGFMISDEMSTKIRGALGRFNAPKA